MATPNDAEHIPVDKLPNEILSEIFSYLPNDSTLLQVALTCQRFRVVVEFYRYHIIKFNWRPSKDPPPPMNGEPRQLQSSFQRFHQLVQNLTAKPRLRDYVSQVSIDLVLHSQNGAFKGHNDLLNLLPSLNSLTLRPPCSGMNLLNLNSLSDLELHFNGGLYCCHFYRSSMDVFFDILHNLHCLRTFCVSALDITDTVSDVWRKEVRKSPITTLSMLKCSDWSTGALPLILSSIVALKSFTLEIERSWEDYYFESIQMEPKDIGFALLQHANTLIQLNIACSNAAYFADSSLFGDFAACSSLQRLAVPEGFLYDRGQMVFYGLDLLRLERLQIQYIMGPAEGPDANRPDKVTILQSMVDYLPALKHIIWWDQNTEPREKTQYGYETAIETLENILEEKGVAFEIVNEVNWDRTPVGKADHRCRPMTGRAECTCET